MAPQLTDLNEAIFNLLSSSSGSYVFIVDATDNLCYWSENGVSQFNLPGEKFPMYGLLESLVHPEDLNRFQRAYGQAVRGRQAEVTGLFRLKTQNGLFETYHCRLWRVQMRDHEVPIFLAGVITEPDGSRVVDPVTSLPTNFAFRRELAAHTCGDSPWTVLMLGIDDFKTVNDLYSYSFGDKALRIFAGLIRDLLPGGAKLYRLDGDGFGVLFPGDCGDITAAWYQRFRERLQKSVEVDGFGVTLTFSGGLCRYPQDGDDYEILYHNASLALRCAKREGKDRLVTFSSEISERERANVLMLARIREAITVGFAGFSLLYQPLVHAEDGSLAGCEALLRWIHPDYPRGISTPEFIPYLEESGLILEMGRWVIDTALRQCARWVAMMPDFQMNINVSSAQFEDPSFKFTVMDKLAEHGVKPSNITLELTESGKVDDPAVVRVAFDFLRSQGISIAFDDFGTGYASLGIFRVLSADELKIDRSFLERISYDVTDQALISTLISLCHDMNMSVCVEGIETRELESQVREMEPDLLQGYYYGRPMSAEQFTATFFSREQRAHRQPHTPPAAPEQQHSMVYAPFRPAQPMDMEGIVNNAYAGILQVGLDREFTILSCNEGYRRMLGYTAAEVEKKFKNHAIGFVHPDDADFVNDEIRRQLGLGDTVTVEFRVVRKDGAAVWVLGTGNVARGRDGAPSLIVVIIGNDRFKSRELADRRIQSLYQDFLRYTPAGLKCLRADPGLTIDYISPGFLELLGYTAAEIQDLSGGKYLNLVVEQDRHALQDGLERLEMGTVVCVRYRCPHKDGHLLWMETISRLGAPGSDGIPRIFSNVVDVSDRVDLEAPNQHGPHMAGHYNPSAPKSGFVWEYSPGGSARTDSERDGLDWLLLQSRFDPLTGLLNKGATEDSIRAALGMATDGCHFALMALDLDQFKLLNDNYGHLFGDKVLVEVSRYIRGFFDRDTIIGRVGGDEFMVLMRYNGDIAQAEETARLLAGAFLQGLQADGGRIVPLGVSIGISCYPEDGVHFYDLFRRADSALYRAKATGHHAICLAAR